MADVQQRRSLREIIRDGDFWGSLLMAAALCYAMYFIVNNEELVRRMLNYNPFG
ncbi:MAG: hypothetical protein AAB480_02645 [Patescibacteria group bacterium]